MDPITLGVALTVATFAAVTASLGLRRDVREWRRERNSLAADAERYRRELARIREALGIRYTPKDYADVTAAAVARGKSADLEIDAAVTTERMLGPDIDRDVARLVGAGELVGTPDDPSTLSVAPQVPPARAEVLTTLVDLQQGRSAALDENSALTGGAATVRDVLRDRLLRFMRMAGDRAGNISDDFRGKFATTTIPRTIKSAIERAEKSATNRRPTPSRKDRTTDLPGKQGNNGPRKKGKS